MLRSQIVLMRDRMAERAPWAEEGRSMFLRLLRGHLWAVNVKESEKWQDGTYIYVPLEVLCMPVTLLCRGLGQCL
jgi:hypothetical protein